MSTPISCGDAETRIAAEALGSLDAQELPSLRAHLEGCATCRHTASTFASTAALLPLSVSEIEPPTRLRTRLMAQVYAEASGQRSRSSLLQRLWRRVPSARAFTVATALSTAVAMGAIVVTTRSSRPPAPRSQPASMASFSVTGTTVQPLAHGSVRYDATAQQAVLSVQGLPEPPPAPKGVLPSTYEVWLIRPNAVAVPAALLTESPDHQTWTAVIHGDISRFRSLAATLEPAGGSSSPTGTEVLNGSLTAG